MKNIPVNVTPEIRQPPTWRDESNIKSKSRSTPFAADSAKTKGEDSFLWETESS